MDSRREAIRVAAVDESELVIHGVETLLKDRIPRFSMVDSPAQATLALIDPSLPGRSVPVRDQLRSLRSQAEHVVLFSWKINSIHDLLVQEHQLSGAVSKASDGATLAAALERIARGERVMMVPAGRNGDKRLAARETQCLQLLSRGLTNREIAQHLNLSPETVKTVLSRSYAKIGVRNRAQAAAWAIRAGFSDAA
jgi:DNA-binding NarL/FixJ family response regulator